MNKITKHFVFSILFSLFIDKAELLNCNTTNICPGISICTLNKCTCPEGFIFNELNQTCNCPVNYLKILNPLKCLPMALYPGFGCELNEQCNELGIDVVVNCTNYKCICPQDSHISGNKCFKTLSLGNKCNHSQECTTKSNPHVHCDSRNSTCICNNGFKEDPKYPKICIPGGRLIKPGDECIYDEYCKEFLGDAGVCLENKCNCSENYNYVKKSKKCIVQAKEAMDCKSSSVCPGIMECIESKCECPPGFIKNEAKNECTCPTNFIEIFKPSPKCLPVALYPGFGCEVNDQCKDLGVNVIVDCVNNKCKCPDNSHVSGTKCYKTLALGDHCTSNEECATRANPNVICYSGNSTCICKDGFKENSTFPKMCAPGGKAIKPGDPCVYDDYCRVYLGEFGNCLGKFCSCMKKYHYGKMTEKCIKNKVLGEDCTDLEDCYLSKNIERVQCSNHKCKCKSGFQEDKNKQQCSNAASPNQSVITLFSLTIFSFLLKSLNSILTDSFT